MQQEFSYKYIFHFKTDVNGASKRLIQLVLNIKVADA